MRSSQREEGSTSQLSMKVGTLVVLPRSLGCMRRSAGWRRNRSAWPHGLIASCPSPTWCARGLETCGPEHPARVGEVGLDVQSAAVACHRLGELPTASDDVQIVTKRKHIRASVPRPVRSFVRPALAFPGRDGRCRGRCGPGHIGVKAFARRGLRLSSLKFP